MTCSDSFALPLLAFGVSNPAAGWSFSLRGTNVGRKDQNIVASAGTPGVFNVGVTWNEIPHNYSNKALTPYTNSSGGVLRVPATIPITFKKLATVAGDEPGVLASDQLAAAYQAEFLAPTPARHADQPRALRVRLEQLQRRRLQRGVRPAREDRHPSPASARSATGRPARSTSSSPSPWTTCTNEITLAAEHDGGTFQVRGEYFYSDFANGIDTLRWENVWASAAPGADYDVWDRLVATTGARPLSPDNQYHNATVTAGVNMPPTAGCPSPRPSASSTRTRRCSRTRTPQRRGQQDAPALHRRRRRSAPPASMRTTSSTRSAA